MMQRWAGIGVLGALVLYLHLVPLQSQLELNADSERDLFRTAGLVEYGIWPKQGPAIDFLPVSLGPGWYLASAPALAVNSNPYSVHVLHILVLVLGLFLLYRTLRDHIGPTTALLTCLLMGTSHHLAQVTVRLWHNALLPGVTLIWFWLLHKIVCAEHANRRAQLLFLAWLTTAFMLQLHLVSVAYALPLAFLHVRTLQRDRWAAGWQASLALVVPALLLIGYVVVLSGLNWDHVAALRAQRAAGGLALGDMFGRLPEHLWSGWSSPSTHWLAVCVLLGALWGLARTVRDIRTTWAFPQWCLLQVLVGMVVVAALSGLHPEPRYFNGLVPGVYILAGLGFAHALRHVPSRLHKARWSGPVMLALTTLVVFWGGWLHWPESQSEDEQPFEMSFNEQQRVIDQLHHVHGLSYTDLNQRVHGPVFGALAAPRYLAYTHGMPAEAPSTTLPPDHDILVAPAGFPITADAETKETIDGGSGRSIAIQSVRRRFNTHDVQIRYEGRVCDIGLPYHWSHLPPDELQPFGFQPSPGLESCSLGGPLDGSLSVTIAQTTANAALTLLLGWFDVSRDHVEDTWVEVASGDGQWSRLTPMKTSRSMALYRFPKNHQTNSIQWRIRPVEALAVIDLY
jgi:hypothetical protein